MYSNSAYIISFSAIWFIERAAIYPDDSLFDTKKFKLMDFYKNFNCPLLMFTGKCDDFGRMVVSILNNMVYVWFYHTLIIWCLILLTGIYINEPERQ